MKKLLLLVLFAFVTFGVVACVTDTTTTTTTSSGTTTTTTTATTATTTTTTTAATTTTTTATTTTTTTTTTAQDLVAPIILGVNDVTIYIGDTFNVLAGISALDDVDGSITANIVVSGDYDIATAGTYTITYTVSDAAGNVATEVRELRVKEAILNTFYIINGDFSDILEEPWGHWAGEGGASSATIVDGVLVYNVTAVGNLTYSNQFSQVDRVVETGKIYQVSFKAKADLARPMIVQLENRSNYVKYWGTTVELTTDWVTYTFAFEVTLASITTGKLGFFLGNIGSNSVATTVYLDDVVVTELDELPGDTTAPTITGVGAYTVEIGIPFNPLQGVAITDDYDLTISVDDITVSGTVDVQTAGEYTLTYTATDESGNTANVTRIITVSTTPPPSTFVIANGDFAVDQLVSNVTGTGDGEWIWKTDGGATGAFTASITGGEAVFNVTAIGDVAHGVQFYLLGRALEQGRTYRISFDAKADIARPIKVVLENSSYVRQFDLDFDVTTGYTTFSFDYYHSGPSLNNGKFAFFLGLVGTTSVPTTIYLDNITVIAITTAPDTENPVINGATNVIIQKDSIFDPLFGITVTDNKDGGIRVVDIVLTGVDTVDTTTPGIYQVTYSLTDVSGNTTTIVRNITVVDGAAPTTLVLDNADFERDQFVSVNDNGWLWKTGWQVGGAFTATIDNGMAVVNVTAIGTVPHGVQFYQQNRITVSGATYLITFRAKAETPRPIKLIFENGSARYLDVDFDLTTEWATYTCEFNYTWAGTTVGKFGFFLGNVGTTSVPTTIYLDDITVETEVDFEDTVAPTLLGVENYYIVQGSAFDPLFGVKVLDQTDKDLTVDDITVTGTVDPMTLGAYDVTYVITDASGNTTTVVRTINVVATTLPSSVEMINSDFEIPQPVSVNSDGWLWKISGTGAFTAEVSGGYATVNVTALGTVAWGVQFFQQNRSFESGNTYKITFKAKADIARPIMLAVEGGNSSTTRLYDNIYDLTTEWVTYEAIVRFADIASFTNGKVALFMGLVGTTSVATTIYVDDFVVEQIGYTEDTTAPVFVGANDITITVNDIFDPMSGVSVFDLYDKTLAVTDITVTGLQVTENLGVYTFDSSVAGVYQITYVVMDKYNNETTLVRNVTVSTGLAASTIIIPNGDFEIAQLVSNTTGTGDGEWVWKTGTGGTFNFSMAAGISTIEVLTIGDVFYGVQFYLANRTATQGQVYMITFRAKADDPRPMKITFESGGKLLNQDIDLTTEWTTYTVYYEHTGATVTNGKFAFFFGAVGSTSIPTTVYMDDVVVVSVAKAIDTEKPVIIGVENYLALLGEDFDPMLGVKVTDNLDKTLKVEHVLVSGSVDVNTLGDYVLTYTLRDASGNVQTVLRTVTVTDSLVSSSLELVNADFETPQAESVTSDGWYWKISGTGAFTAAVNGGIATVNVTSLGTVAWGVQFFQQNRMIETGTTYKITFMAKADIARPIMFAVEGGESSTFRLYDEIFNLSTEWATYETVIRVTNIQSFINGKFAFFLGLVGTTSIETTIYFDNIVIEQIGNVVDDTAPIILGVTDATINVSDVLDVLSGIKVFDIYDRSLTPASIVITGAQISNVEGVYSFDSTVQGVFTITYTLTDQSGNTTVIERSVTVN